MAEQEQTKKDESGNKEVIMLRGEKLKTLAKLVHQEEVNQFKNMSFKSEAERGQYLRDSQETYKSAVGMVDEANELNEKQNNNQELKKNIAHEYLKYVEYGVGGAARTIWNLHLRSDYLKKLRDHAQSLVPEIEEMYELLDKQPSAASEAEAQELAKKIAAYKDVQYQRMVNWETPTSRNLSLACHKSGETFEKMVEKYRLKLVKEKGAEFDKPFHLLDDEKKIEVYDKIAKASGRGKFIMNGIAKVGNAAAKGILLLTLGLMVWDIYGSKHKLQTTVVDSTELALTLLGGLGGEFFGAAIGTAVVDTAVGTAIAAAVATIIDVDIAVVSYSFVCLIAGATGLGAAIAVGFLTALAINHIIHSGGHPEAAKPANNTKKIHSSDNTTVYVAPMPNGNLLARQLAYQGGTN